MGRTCFGRTGVVRSGRVSKETGTPSAPTARDGELRVTIAGFEWRHLPTSSANADQRWVGLAICRQDCSRNCRECGSLRGEFGGQFGGQNMFGSGRQSATTEAIGFLCVRVYALYFRFRNVFFNQLRILAQKIFVF